MKRFLITRTNRLPSFWAAENDLECHETREQAERALAILNEHEERNGRGSNFWKIVEEEDEKR